MRKRRARCSTRDEEGSGVNVDMFEWESASFMTFVHVPWKFDPQ